jgi:4-amino-4-deoxy-L-arabinose transferase-like glycosyltransferase
MRPSRPAALLFFAAFAARAAFVVLEPPTRRVDDEPVWVTLGREVAAAGFSPLRNGQVFHPPLYPYFLGALDAAFGLEGVKWGQALVGAALAPILFLLGRRAYGERVGLFAGALAALYPELVWYCAHFWSEIVFVTLLWWGFERLLASEEGSAPAAATAGVLLGLATLVRETILFFLPVMAFWLVRGSSSGRRRAAVFLVSAAAVIAPWTVRNAIVTGTLVPVATRGSFNVWLGNTLRPWDEVYREHHAVEGGPIAQERHARREALRAVAERQPRWLLDKLVHENRAFWGVNDQVVVHLERRAYKRLSVGTNRLAASVTVLPYLLVLVLAVPALASMRWRGDRASLLLLGFLLFSLALHVVAFASPRFRLPVLPLLFLLAGQTLDRGLLPSWRALRGKRRAAAVIVAGLLALSVGASILETSNHPAFTNPDEGGGVDPVRRERVER